MLRKSILQVLIWWMVVFSLLEVFFIEVITIENHLAAILYWAVIVTVLIVVNKKLLADLVQDTRSELFLLPLVSLVIHSIIFWYCTNFLNEPTQLIENNTASFLLLSEFFLFGKPLQVLFQQLMIVILVKKLSERGVVLKQIMLITALFFGLTHLFLVRAMELELALYFTIPALLASIAFPYLILRVKNGYLYSFMIHLSYYAISPLLFWS